LPLYSVNFNARILSHFLFIGKRISIARLRSDGGRPSIYWVTQQNFAWVATERRIADMV